MARWLSGICSPSAALTHDRWTNTQPLLAPDNNEHLLTDRDAVRQAAPTELIDSRRQISKTRFEYIATKQFSHPALLKSGRWFAHAWNFHRQRDR